jgi:hypothetical protein
MKSMMVETVGLTKGDLERFNKHPLVPPTTKRSFHGFEFVTCRKDYKNKTMWRGKLRVKDKFLNSGSYIDPITPQILIDFIKQELKNE